MELSKSQEKYLYSIGITAYQSIEPSEIKEIDKERIMLQPNYISNRINHKFLPSPLIEVYYDLIKDDTIIGYYKIYLDLNNIIIEEILFLA